MEIAALCTDPSQHGVVLIKLHERLEAVSKQSHEADDNLRQQFGAEVTRLENEIEQLREALSATDKKADKILELTISIERLTGQIEQLETKVESLVESKKLGLSTILGIIQSIITAAVLLWLGLK